VALGVGWAQDRIKLARFKDWWWDHLHREHYNNPNDYKRLIERDGPPLSI